MHRSGDLRKQSIPMLRFVLKNLCKRSVLNYGFCFYLKCPNYHKHLMFTLPNRSALLLTLLFVLLLHGSSCRKAPDSTNNNPQTPATTPDFTTTIQSSVSGYVKADWGASGQRLQGALVQYGDKTTTTDEYGYFEIKDARVIQYAAQLIVSKTNYETGYKTFQLTDGKAVFTRMTLQGATGGGFSAAAGTTISLNAFDAEVKIAPNTLVVESTNTLYTGSVSVIRNYKKPNDDGFAECMPGGLQGIDSSGKMKLLSIHNFGNIVLYGLNGEKLKLAAGKTAELKFYLWGVTATSIPSGIHLWHYDATKGFWQQKGMASVSASTEVKTDIRELGHFAVGTASEYVRVTGRFTGKTGLPLGFAGVRFVSQNASIINIDPVWHYSNEQGYFSGYVRADAQHTIRLYAKCESPLYSKNFATGRTDVPLGEMVLTDDRVVTVKATLKACGGGKVTNGYVYSLNDDVRYAANNEGVVEFCTVACDYVYRNGLQLIPVEIPTAQTGNTAYVKLVPGANDAGNLSVCGTDATIRFSCNLVDAAGNPLPDLFVRIAPVTDLQNPFRLTSITGGLVSTAIYTNRDYQLSVFGSLQCNTPVFTTNFSTVNRDTSIGNLTITGLAMATITGTVVDCNNNPVPNGIVIIYKDQKGMQAPVNSAGSFTYNIPLCNSSGAETVYITAVNASSLLPGTTISTTVQAGTKQLTVNSCSNPPGTMEYFNYVIDDQQYRNYLPPQDTIKFHFLDNGARIGVQAQHKITLESNGFSFPSAGIAVGSSHSLEDFYLAEINAYPTGPSLLHITEYGPVGGYVAGTAEGTLEDVNLKQYKFRMSFRVKRTY
jgi:hypothetical protein